jgi:RNA polymerase-binding transcription factor DksA
VSTDTDAERTRLLQTIEADLAGVRQAMERLDAGTYFTCATCGASLDEVALSDRPTLQHCQTCVDAALDASASRQPADAPTDATDPSAGDRTAAPDQGNE